MYYLSHILSNIIHTYILVQNLTFCLQLAEEKQYIDS